MVDTWATEFDAASQNVQRTYYNIIFEGSFVFLCSMPTLILYFLIALISLYFAAYDNLPFYLRAIIHPRAYVFSVCIANKQIRILDKITILCKFKIYLCVYSPCELK